MKKLRNVKVDVDKDEWYIWTARMPDKRFRNEVTLSVPQTVRKRWLDAKARFEKVGKEIEEYINRSKSTQR